MTFARATPLMQRARSSARLGPPIGGSGSGSGLHRLAALLSVAALVMLMLSTAHLAASAGGQAMPAPPPPRRVRGGLDSGGSSSSKQSDNAGPGPGARLLLAHVAFRHGARTPLVQLKDFAGVKWACNEQYAGAPVTLVAGAAPGAGAGTTGAAPPLAPADEGAPELPGGCRMGTLTERGFEMALQLGRELRARYITAEGAGGDGSSTSSSTSISSSAGLIPAQYDPRIVAAHATNYRRTRATLKGVLNGMFPAEKGSFRAAATPERRTYFYPANASCPALMPAIKELSERADTREAAAPRRAADEVRAALKLGKDDGGGGEGGGKGAPPLNWGALRDVLSCRLAEAPEERPEALTDRLWGVIQAKATARELAVYAPGPWNCHAAARACNDVLRLSVGPLLWRVLGTMEEAAAAAAAANSSSSSDGLPSTTRLESAGAVAAIEAAAAAAGAAASTAAAAPPRLYLWSAHDSTVHALLAALGSDAGGAWAPFAADVALELWQGNDGGDGGSSGGSDSSSSGGGGGEFWVRALYLGKPLDLRGAGGGGGGGGGASALGRRGGAGAEAQAAGGGGGPSATATGGWLRLSALRERLRPVIATDDEKERECWGE